MNRGLTTSETMNVSKIDKDIQLITVSETANLLAVHRSTVYRLILTDTEFPKIYKFGFGKRLNKHEVMEYIDSRKSA